MFTYQSVVDLARIPLNDVDKARYDDATLLLFANHIMQLLVKRRPDLFIGQYNNLPDGQSALTDTFPLPVAFVQTVADGVTGRAEMTDDEFANSGRASLFAQLLGTEAPA